MQPTNYPKYPWTAEDMGSFVVERTNLVGGTIERPSLLKSPWFPVLVLAVLSMGAYVAYNLYYAEFMKNTIIWMVAVIAVYWFSVSGGMFNIIRGVPMQHFDRASGKVRPCVDPCTVHAVPCKSLQKFTVLGGRINMYSSDVAHCCGCGCGWRGA